MPIYEFQCAGCRCKMSVFVRGFTVTPPAKCERCGHTTVRRVFSAFAVRKTKGVDALDESAMGDLDENDPKAMAKMMRNMKGDLGDEAGPGFDELVDRMEAGEDMGDLTDDDSGGEDPM